jgi:hypothetical protein
MTDNNDLLRTDKKEVEAKKKDLARVRRYRELKDIKEILSTPAGRRVWRRLLEECAPLRSNVVVGDSYGTHVNSGRQQIGIWALCEMDEARPATYTEMAREHKSDVILSEELDKQAEKEMEN